MNAPHRPYNVPSNARWETSWNESEFLWVVGNEENGVRQGPYRYYRADGTLCSEDIYVDGILQGPAKRFHENGEISQQGEILNDKRHGFWLWQRSTGPTTEHTLPSTCAPAVWSGSKVFDNGKAGPAIYYDRNGAIVNPDGSPIPARPTTVPPEAEYYMAENTWFLGFTADENAPTHRVGKWTWWNAKGVVLRDITYNEKGLDIEDARFYDNGRLMMFREKDKLGNLITKRTYHRDGTLRQELRYTFEDDDLVCVETFGDKGVLVSKGIRQDDDLFAYTFYHSNGKVRATGFQNEYEICGTWTFSNDQGHITYTVEVSSLNFDNFVIDENFNPDWVLGNAIMLRNDEPLPAEMSDAGDIDWQNADSAYNENTRNFPAYIGGLISKEASVRLVALDEIRTAAEHQGTLYGITALVTPFLIRALTHANSDKAAILQFLSTITKAAIDSPIEHDSNEDGDTVSPRAQAIQDVLDEIRFNTNVFLHLLDNPDPSVVSASLSLFRYGPDTAELRNKLQKIISSGDETMKAAAVYVLLTLEKTTPQDAEIIHEQHGEIVRLVASIQAALRFGPLAPAGTVTILREVVEKNDRSLREKYHSLYFVEEEFRTVLCLALGHTGDPSARSLLPTLCTEIDEFDSLGAISYSHALLTLATGNGSILDVDACVIVLKAIANSRKVYSYTNSNDVMLYWGLPTQRSELLQLISEIESNPSTSHEGLAGMIKKG